MGSQEVKRVTIEVYKGLAYVVYKDKGVFLTILDRDCLDCGEEEDVSIYDEDEWIINEEGK